MSVTPAARSGVYGTKGKSPRSGRVKQPREEKFLAPGTWTWPGNVSEVEVTVVGGGGGGGAAINATFVGTPGPATYTMWAGGGGGGGVRREVVPVTGPVPVTVGAGGSGATFTPAAPWVFTAGSVGGDSSFGPITVGGGGVGGTSPAPPLWTFTPTAIATPAPPTGGGGGAHGGYFGASVPTSGGTYGREGGRLGQVGGGAAMPGSSGSIDSPSKTIAVDSSTAAGVDGMGGGGGGSQRPVFSMVDVSARDGGAQRTFFGSIPAPMVPSFVDHLNGRPGTGGGGAAAASFPVTPPVTFSVPGGKNQTSGGDGGSGIVIVRWYE